MPDEGVVVHVEIIGPPRCAEASAAGRAAEYEKDGFQSVKVLGGGVEAWKNAGLPML